MIALRASGPLDEIAQSLEETVTMRGEGAFAEPLPESRAYHTWKGRLQGDAPLAELTKPVSQAAVSEIVELLARSAGRFDVYETCTTDVFDQEALEIWWRNPRGGSVPQT